MSRLGQLVLVAAAATLATVLVRALAGEALGSDAYSHLVWARDAVRHGVTSHAPFDYTVPKPFEQGVAVLGTKLGRADVRVRVGVARGRLRVRRRGRGAGAQARAATRPRRSRRSSRFCLPVLWRGGPLGDSNVPYAALVVGAAAAGHGHAGLRRAARASRARCGPRRGGSPSSTRCSAGAGPRSRRAPSRSSRPSRRRRSGSRSTTSSRATGGGRATSSTPTTTASTRRCSTSPHLPGRGRSSASATSRPGRSRCWRSPRSPSASSSGRTTRPSSSRSRSSLALVVVVARGQISADDVGRMLTALAVFAAAGAAVGAGRAQRRHACAARWPSSRSRPCRSPRRRGWRAPCATSATRRARRGRSTNVVAPALEREAPAGYVALPRQWQGQLALSWDRPRSTFIPARAIGDGA